MTWKAGNFFRTNGFGEAPNPTGEGACAPLQSQCSGLTFVSKVCAAGRDDRGMGEYTPEFGFLLRKLSHCVIASDTLFNGFMKEMAVDLGEHCPDCVFANNVGCPMLPEK